jgi:hypothetical protein
MADIPDKPETTEVARPEWLAAFLADRGMRKPSAHTMKAYCQDFDAIATLVQAMRTACRECGWAT